MVVNGTDVTVTGIENISEQEILAYMDLIHRDNQRDEIESLEISAAEGDNVALDYTLRPPKFQRIRRITGYLVGRGTRPRETLPSLRGHPKLRKASPAMRSALS